MAKSELYQFMADLFLKFIYDPQDPEKFFRDACTAAYTYMAQKFTSGEIYQAVVDLANTYQLEVPDDAWQQYSDQFCREVQKDVSLTSRN
jgi:hypothetical protein